VFAAVTSVPSAGAGHVAAWGILPLQYLGPRRHPLLLLNRHGGADPEALHAVRVLRDALDPHIL
jgi:hypothetical protein